MVPPERVPAIARPGLWVARLLARRADAGRAERIMAALTRLGPSYVKLGQFLATRPDIVGVSLARDLEGLQDRMPAFPQAIAEAEIETALGKPVAQLFTRLGPPSRRLRSRRCMRARSGWKMALCAAWP